MKDLSINQVCRICKSNKLTLVFKFGPQPLANAFLKSQRDFQSEKYYPLNVYFCRNCHLLQLIDIVSPKVLFKDYVYVSSTSPLFIKHFEEFARKIVERFSLKKTSLVIDIGSNDGILLKPYHKLGIQVLGIEPSENVAQIARNNSINTITDFFSLLLTDKIINSYGRAEIITATNVFAHINDIDEVAKGVYNLLDTNGVFILEVPYLIDFLDKNLFDTVYHEHISYFSLTPLLTFFKGWQMRIIDVERVSTHGGSLRVFVTKENSTHKISSLVNKLLKYEKSKKLTNLSTYHQFAQRVEINKLALTELLSQLKQKNKRIIGYGAPAKGNTLLNYFGINTQYLDYIVDDSEFKHNLFTPGSHIQVRSSRFLSIQKPDYILILAWNFAKTIMDKYAYLRNKGVKFILPVPSPKII